MNKEHSEWWGATAGPDIAQGDFLPNCLVPQYEADFDPSVDHHISVENYNCIVLTQSCDLLKPNTSLVALCPIFPLEDFEKNNPSMANQWEAVRQGRVASLHLIASYDTPSENRACLVVDFRELYTLPVQYIKQHAERIGRRWRLRSPYLEHFSQAFSRFYMRVGLPSTIPRFK